MVTVWRKQAAGEEQTEVRKQGYIKRVGYKSAEINKIKIKGMKKVKRITEYVLGVQGKQIKEFGVQAGVVRRRGQTGEEATRRNKRELMAGDV